ncbi:HalOD1 output domain-containing protein [Halorubrum amylolyticum]|uniref:HalOD1 output domain-containing protein n=1 Tax=Halorubrum amylolyticum TaxID=2508724 RepID=UPI001008D95B|nr:HalOD1 output domain-containing protein [Halorubrum amylolyticum]
MSEDHLVSRRYDWSDVSPVVGVVEALGDADDADPDAIPALAETVDPESLNELCTSASAENPVTVSFVHASYEMTVRSDGFVAVDAA